MIQERRALSTGNLKPKSQVSYLSKSSSEIEPILEYSGELQSLLSSPLLADIFLQEGVIPRFTHDVSRNETPSPLAVVFEAIDGSGVQSVECPIFGFRNCVGVVVTENTSAETESFLREDPKISPLLQNGDDIVLMRPSDIYRWLNFFTEIKEQGHYRRMGTPTFEISGLTRVTGKYHERLCHSFLTLIEQQYEHLLSSGVENITFNGSSVDWKGFDANIQPEAQLDLPFLRVDLETVVGVPLNHLRTAQVKGSILIEKVEGKQSIVPGFMITHVGENKREAYERAEKARVYYQSKWDRDEKVVVPVISVGQISLWRKLGFAEILRASIRDQNVVSQLEAEDLVRFLYLGKDNLRHSDLASRGFSLPGNLMKLSSQSQEPGPIDLLFYKKDEHGQSQLKILDEEMWGLDLNAMKRGKIKMKPVGNIAGLTIIPSDWSAEDIQNYSKILDSYLARHMKPFDAHILCVNAELFERWQLMGSALVNTTRHREQALSKRVRRLISNGSTELYYARFQGRAAVGGAKTAIVEKNPTGATYHVINFGAEFGLEGKAKEDITARPGTALALRPGFESGKYPMIPGIYELEYLVETARNFDRIRYQSPDDFVASFLRSELVHRMSADDLRQFFPEKAVEKILEYGSLDEKYWYRGGDSILGSIVIPHAHADHFGDKPVLDHAAKEIISHETLALERAADSFAQTWREKQTYTQDIAHPTIGNAYSAHLRPVIPIQYNGQIVNLSKQVSMEPHFAGHSIPGNLMQGFLMSGRLALVYTSDLRFDEFGETEAAVNAFAGRADTIVIETTNPPNTTKPSVGRSESEVMASFERIFSSNPDVAIVVATPKNHPLRLSKIIEAAHNSKRKVAIDYKHILVNESRRFVRSEMAIGADGFNTPIFTLGTDATLWAKTQKKPQPYQNSLYQMAASGELGVVDEERLSEEGSEWVVVVSPHEFLTYLVGGASLKKLVYVYSSYFPYQQHDKLIVGENYQWVQEQFGKSAFYADFMVQGRGDQGIVVPVKRDDGLVLHVSGHASSSQMVDRVLLPLLDGKYKGKQIVLEHGADPDVWKRAFLARANPTDLLERELTETVTYVRNKLKLDRPDQLRIYSHLRGYKPKHPRAEDINDPIGISGFKLRIG